jgi:hypothetical protein
MKSIFLCAIGALACAAPASAQLTETFPDALGGWTSRWLYQNSNMGNYYVISGNGCNEDDRGNNPQGLWLVDDQTCNNGGAIGGPLLTVKFDPGFGATLSGLSFGVEAFSMMDVTIFDLSGNTVGSLIGVSGGGFDFDHKDIVSAVSNNGIGGFTMDSTPYGGGQIEGNTSVDNFSADVVPAPGACGLLAGAGLLAARRRR